MGEGQSGGVNITGISGSNISVDGDVAGGNIIKDNVGNVAMGDGASASGSVQQGISAEELAELMKAWRGDLESKIDNAKGLDDEEKADAKAQVAKIEEEAAKAKETGNYGKLEKAINMLSVMAPDIFEVATTTLVNPLGGIGLVLKKIGDRAKLEQADAAG